MGELSEVRAVLHLIDEGGEGGVVVPREGEVRREDKEELFHACARARAAIEEGNDASLRTGRGEGFRERFLGERAGKIFLEQLLVGKGGEGILLEGRGGGGGRVEGEEFAAEAGGEGIPDGGGGL